MILADQNATWWVVWGKVEAADVCVELTESTQVSSVSERRASFGGEDKLSLVLVLRVSPAAEGARASALTAD